MRDEGAGSGIDNTPPPSIPSLKAVNSSQYTCKVSFSRTQKSKFVHLEFLLFRGSIKICESLFVLYDMYMYCTSISKSNKDFQFNEHTVVKTWNERRK